MGTGESEQSRQLKERGNEAYKTGNWDEAVEYYSKAINLAEQNGPFLAIYLKNRAAAYLKLEKFQEACDDCDKSLGITCGDPKALFRRSQALEKLDRYEEAYRDAREVLNLDPSNKTIQPVLENLYKIVQERSRQNAQISTKVDSMTKIAFDPTAEADKRETAINNLMVLARQSAGATVILQTGIVQKLKTLLKVEKNREIYITSVRIVGELCKHSPDKTKLVVKEVGIPWFLEILDSNCEKQINAAQCCMQMILNSFSGMDNKPGSKPDKELCEKYKPEIDTLLTCLVCSVNSRIISGPARDSIMELLIKNVNWDALNWAERLVDNGGVDRLMECASELEEYKYESAMNITPSSRTIAAVCLSRVYDNMYYDALKEKFMNSIENFVRDKLLNPEIEAKVRAVVAMTSLLRGPLDVGNSVIGKEGIVEMVLVMANTDDILQQKAAVECIIAAASKADKAKAIISNGLDILKRLYKSSVDSIRVRALVGLCKLGSCSGSDASMRPFKDGSTLKLAEACRKFLLQGKDNDLRKWAAEGLSYLTLDAEVKEKLIDDRPALKALIELAKTRDQSVLYGIVTTLVNLCNAYEKQEVLPEMIELAKFAKQHIPQEHELDDPDFVKKRLLVLGHEGVTIALVALGKTESHNSRELMARVFNALCGEPELRGLVVQQGGVKVLLLFSLEGTDKGKRHASQALARIAISINPEVAFTGQRSLEVIRPLVNLLHPDCNALENFEALLGLCNIAQMSETARQRIMKEGGISKIDHYLYEDHEMLKRAAMQCITNLTMSPDVVEIYEAPNDKVKYLVILCEEEDVETSMAASGALAILTGVSEKCCLKIVETGTWLDSIKFLLANPNVDVQYRGVNIVRNMIESSSEVAEKVIETDVMEILMALCKLEDGSLGKVKEIAADALKAAESLGIIRKPEPEPGSSSLQEIVD